MLCRLSSATGAAAAAPGKEEDGEDVPMVAEIIDECPEEVKLMEEFRMNSKWKLLGDQNEDWQGSGPAESATRPQRCDSLEPWPPAGKHNSSLELCPLRRQRHDTPDPSPPRRRRPGTPDLSPLRQQSQDLSPRRENPASRKKSRRKGRTLPAGKAQLRSPSPQERSPPCQDTKGSPKKAHTMSCGAKAGLLLAEVRQKEKQGLWRHQRSSKQLEEESREAQTVFRDKWGCKRNLAQEQLEQRLKAEVESWREERYARWGKGLAQQRQQQQNVEDAIQEMQKPLARYIQDLDQMLREQEREGDPMAALIKKRKAKESKEEEKPRYKGPAPPLNRFNIWPGHCWDGVDRSEGLEQQRCARGATSRASRTCRRELLE